MHSATRHTGQSRGAGESYFTKVHEDANIRIKQRLYMTATPKIFTDKIRRAADAQERKIYAMDDERVYGPVFYELKFDEAVHKHEALSDYRVRIAFIDPSLMDPDLQASLTDEQGLLPLNEKNKMVAAWHSLLHPDRDEDTERLLQRVIVFSNTIRASKRFAGVADGPSSGSSQDSFGGVVSMVKAVKPTDNGVEARHVDGKTRALERKKQLRWLGESGRDPHKCRLLSNARCLSEGIDVPALDGVIFMEPRKSMVDVVQAVGRVMRRHPWERSMGTSYFRWRCRPERTSTRRLTTARRGRWCGRCSTPCARMIPPSRPRSTSWSSTRRSERTGASGRE